MQDITRAKVTAAALVVPAVSALIVSVHTSYRFFGERLGITDHIGRLLLCGVGEAAIVALTARAWGLRRRLPLLLVYVLAALLVGEAAMVWPVGQAVLKGGLGPVLLVITCQALVSLAPVSTGQNTHTAQEVSK